MTEEECAEPGCIAEVGEDDYGLCDEHQPAPPPRHEPGGLRDELLQAERLLGSW